MAAEKLSCKYQRSTIEHFVSLLRVLDRYCDLDKPEEVLAYIRGRVRDAKRNYWQFYKIYANYYGLKLPEVRFPKNRKVPYVPPREMLEDVVKACRTERIRKALRVMLETGCRVGELKQLRFDKARRAAIIVCEKKHGEIKERMVPVKEEIAFLDGWETRPKAVKDSLRRVVKKLARRTGNLDYLKIHCHTFRHFFATEVYAKTGDLILVKELLGHEDIRETQIYVHIVRMSNPKKEAIKVDINDSEKMLELIRQGWKVAVQTDKFIIFEKPTFP